MTGVDQAVSRVRQGSLQLDDTRQAGSGFDEFIQHGNQQRAPLVAKKPSRDSAVL
jgi:hypothetical protein